MRNILILAITSIALLCTTTAIADSRYITDKISISLFSQNDAHSKTIKKLPSGAVVSTLEEKGEFTRIQTSDDIEGWVESKYLTNEKPSQIEYLQTAAKYKVAQEKIQDYQTRLLELQELRKEAKTVDWLREKLNDYQRTENALEQNVKLKEIEIADLKITVANLEHELMQYRNQVNEASGAMQGSNNEQLTSDDDSSLQTSYTTSSSVSFYTWLVLSLAVTLIIGILMGFVLIDYKVRKKHVDLSVY